MLRLLRNNGTVKSTHDLKILGKEETVDMTITEETTETIESTNDTQWRRPLSDDKMAADIAELIRATFTNEQREAMVRIAERILEKIVEAEVREAVAPRIEALYEGVIVGVMQKLLMQALTERASSTLASLTKGG